MHHSLASLPSKYVGAVLLSFLVIVCLAAPLAAQEPLAGPKPLKLSTDTFTNSDSDH